MCGMKEDVEIGSVAPMNQYVLVCKWRFYKAAWRAETTVSSDEPWLCPNIQAPICPCLCCKTTLLHAFQLDTPVRVQPVILNAWREAEYSSLLLQAQPSLFKYLLFFCWGSGGEAGINRSFSTIGLLRINHLGLWKCVLCKQHPTWWKYQQQFPNSCASTLNAVHRAIYNDRFNDKTTIMS